MDQTTAPDATRHGRIIQVALLASLAVAWLNLLLTTRWASEPGALHGWRLPWYGAALALATGLAGFWAWRGTTRPAGRAIGPVTLTGGMALLVAAFLAAYPLARWAQYPFYDDWPGLLQLAANGVDLLRRGAVVGWNWAFLGGYQTSADLSQSLFLTAIVPFSLFGPTTGFHVLLAAYTVIVPLAVYLDVRLDGDRRVTLLATGLACVLTAGYLGTVMRSGMANVVAGVGFTGLALAGSHAARVGRRWGGPLLVAGLTVVLYSHAAFFLYAAAYLGLEALFYRSWRTAFRSAIALTLAFVAALPLHWELVRYPAFFVTNNLYWAAPPSFDWAGFARNVYYAAEILVRPSRWFNDYVGVAHVWLPAVIVVAFFRRTRPAFYAWAALATVAMLRLNTPQLGIILARELYIYPLLLAPALGAFVAALPSRPPLAWAVVAVLGLFVAVPFGPVPHVPTISAFNGALVDQIRSAPGDMVLIENNPHWNMIATPGVHSEKSRFDTHYESLLPAATGKRFFGQPQDGYHRSTFRGQMVGGGAYQGRAIADTPPAAFAAELRRWGIARLFVWSESSIRYFESSPLFEPRWRADPWREFALQNADTRQVVTASGTGTLTHYDALEATIALADVHEGDRVVVRTNYYPAWTAASSGRTVTLVADGGQLAFAAPASGTYQVQLSYPRRTLFVIACWLLALVGAVVLSLRGSGEPAICRKPEVQSR